MCEIKDQILNNLENRGLLQQTDLQLIDVLVYQIKLEKKLRDQLELEGFIYTDRNGQKRRNPVYFLYKSTIESIQGLSKTLGLFPLNRQKVKSEKYISDPTDELAKFLNDI